MMSDPTQSPPIKVYGLAGLGADARVWEQLSWSEGVSFVPIEWVPPLAGDSIGQYAKRLLPQIDRKHPNLVLLGLSFGGMVAIELSKYLPACKVILLSSASTSAAIPVLYKRLSFLLPLLPTAVFRWPNPILYYLFGIKTPVHKALFKTMLKDSDPQFFRWALMVVLSWDNYLVPADYQQIHGTKDRILPQKSQRLAIHWVEDGGHLMVLEQASKVSAILQQLI